MAREKFEDRTLTGKVRVTCKFEDGTIRIWDARKEDVVQHIVDIVNLYAADQYLLTLRQLHYQLVKSNWIVNHDSAYKKLGSILDDCKYAGLIDWDNIEDRGRLPYIPYWVTGIEGALKDTIDQYRLDRQKGQHVHVELWTEKDALSAILKRSTQKYHIQLVVNKGYTSSSAIHNAYKRFIRAIAAGQVVDILYFGDHDPSGLDMVRDIRDRIEFMLLNGRHSELFDDVDVKSAFRILPIGLTMDQIKEYNLPPNPTKLTDSRAEKYIKKYGKTCWEVDALNPQILTDIIETNIQDIIDMDQFEAVLVREKVDILKLQNFVKNKK